MTQKLYSATVDGKRRIGEMYFNLFRYFNDDNVPCWINSRGTTDLTEVEFHAKGTGVWIKGVTAEELEAVLKYAYSPSIYVEVSHLHGAVGIGMLKETVCRILAQLSPEASASGEKKCPTCDSPDPKRHPAVQFEGEVQICKDAFHSPSQPLGDTEGGERWTCITCNAEHPTILRTCPFCSGKVKEEK